MAISYTNSLSFIHPFIHKVGRQPASLHYAAWHRSGNWLRLNPWWTCDHFVGNVSAMGQPTRPTQPSILQGR